MFLYGEEEATFLFKIEEERKNSIMNALLTSLR